MSTKPPKKSQRIIIADDDPAILRLVKTIVEKEGYQVVEANNGRDAHKILQQDANFVAAIFDITMPHVTGLDLARFMQSEKPLKNIPVIIMTAEHGLNVQSDSFAAGAVVFIPKPFTNTQLQTMLRMLIQTSA
jgi:CheY-like chemotaxis protein